MNSGDLGPTDSSNKGHLTRECRVTTEGRGRTVDEWKLRVAGLDNHWLDGLVGSGVAASIQGVELPEMKTYKPVRRRVTYAGRQRRNEAARAMAEFRSDGMGTY
jgi:hypothetical protein